MIPRTRPIPLAREGTGKVFEVEELCARGKAGDSHWFLAVDARVKILLVAFGLFLSLLVPSGRAALGLTVLALFGLRILGIKGRQILHRLGPALLLVGVLFLTRIFFYGGHPLLVLNLGVPVALYREGLEVGLLLLFRVLAGVTLLMLLQAITPLPELVEGLRRLGLPPLLAEVTLLVSRYIFVLGEEAVRIREAARVRLGLAGWRRALHSYSGLAGMVLWRAYDRAENVHRAMRARAYQGQVPPVLPRPLSGRDLLVGAAGGAVLLAIFGLTYWP